MNVNPFSYLIEKLKGKVDKSGDTMSGNLNLEKSGGEISVKCQNTTKLTSAYIYSANSGEHGIWSNGYHDGTFHNSGLWLVNRGTDGSVKVNGTSVPSNGGTVALETLTDLTITLNTNVLYDNNTKVYGVKFGNIAIITGILMVKGAVSRDDVLFTISGFTPTQLTYCTATKTTANKSFLMRFDANGTQAVVDETPATATSNWDFFGFNMVLYHK